MLKIVMLMAMVTMISACSLMPSFKYANKKIEQHLSDEHYIFTVCHQLITKLKDKSVIPEKSTLVVSPPVYLNIKKNPLLKNTLQQCMINELFNAGFYVADLPLNMEKENKFSLPSVDPQMLTHYEYIKYVVVSSISRVDDGAIVHARIIFTKNNQVLGASKVFMDLSQTDI